MGVAKALSQAELFGVLSDRARLGIVFLLAEAERSPGELVALTGLAPPTVSHHLRTLRLHGLVGVRRVHRNLFYRLAGTGGGEEGEGEGAGLVIRGRDGYEVCLRRRVRVGVGARDADGQGLGEVYRHVGRCLGALAPFVWTRRSEGESEDSLSEGAPVPITGMVGARTKDSAEGLAVSAEGG